MDEKRTKKDIIWKFLWLELQDGAKFISFSTIAKKKAISCARSTVKYWVNVLIKEGKLRVVDEKLELIRNNK